MPLELLGPRVAGIKAQLTVTPRAFQDRTPRPIPVFSTDVPGYLGLPIDWALGTFPNVEWEDRTVQGEESYFNKLPDPHHPRAAPGQDRFMRDLLEAASNFYTVLAKAKTGSGKTVVALNTAAQLGRRTLIQVHLERLGRQWRDEVNDKLGIPYEDIGWVQGDTFDWQKPYVIGIAETIAGRRFHQRFYESFGTIITDEVHRTGAPTLAQTLGRFPAKNKIALTATDKRKDRCERVYYFHFGKPAVISEQEVMPCKVHAIPVRVSVPQWCKMHGSVMSELAQDDAYNRVIVSWLCRMYDEGRTFLAIGDDTRHLQKLIQMCGAEGIPFKEMGLFVNRRYTDHYRETYQRAKGAALKQQFVYRPAKGEETPAFDTDARITIIGLLGNGYFRARLTSDVIGAYPEGTVHLNELRHLPQRVPQMVKVSHDELDRIKETAVGFFATYGMLKEGIDIPRLDAGCDVTPRADMEQVLGRIRRIMEGKADPYWVTPKHIGHPILERYVKGRKKEAIGCGAEWIDYA